MSVADLAQLPRATVGIDRKLEGALRSASARPSGWPSEINVGIDRKLEGALRS